MGGQGEGTRKVLARGTAGPRGPAQSHGWDRRAGRQRGRRPGRDTGGCHRAAGPTGGRRGRGPSGKSDRGAGGPGGTAGRGKARRKGGRGEEGRQLGDGGRVRSSRWRRKAAAFALKMEIGPDPAGGLDDGKV